MLTNGSFVSLKDIPTGSDEGSTRLTASTVDDSNSSDTSSGSGYNNIGEFQYFLFIFDKYWPHSVTGLTSKSIRETSVAVLNAVGPGQANIKRSNTSAAQLTSVGGHLTTKLEPGNQTMTSSNGGNNMRRSHNTGYYSFRDYSPVYGTATLSRGPRAYG